MLCLVEMETVWRDPQPHLFAGESKIILEAIAVRGRRERDPCLQGADTKVRQVRQSMAQDDAFDSERDFRLAIHLIEQRHERSCLAFKLGQIRRMHQQARRFARHNGFPGRQPQCLARGLQAHVHEPGQLKDEMPTNIAFAEQLDRMLRHAQSPANLLRARPEKSLNALGVAFGKTASPAKRGQDAKQMMAIRRHKIRCPGGGFRAQGSAFVGFDQAQTQVLHSRGQGPQKGNHVAWAIQVLQAVDRFAYPPLPSGERGRG